MIATIARLTALLHRHRRLFEALFEKRHRHVLAHEVLEYIEEEPLAFLIEAELLTQHEESIELDDRVLTFFEEMLQTSGDIEIGDVDEMIQNMQHNIALYRNEHESHKERYLLKIERTLKKTPQMILKNLNMLQLHIGLTYKTQKSHKNKIMELGHYRQKLEKLIAIEQKIDHVLEIEKPFFAHLARHDTVMLQLRLKGRLRELRVSLTALQQEVIEYINKSIQNLAFYEQMIKLKELKNALELKERTNIVPLLEQEKMPVSFEKLTHHVGLLETDYIYEEHFEEVVDTLRESMHLAPIVKPQAEGIHPEFFEESHDMLSMVDVQLLHSRFCESKKELFDFVQTYPFSYEKSFQERIEIYCQMALMYEEFYTFSHTFESMQGFTYLKIFPQVSNP